MQSSPVYYVPDPIHPLMATIAAPACALGDRDGQIRPQGVQGLYVSDMRVLHGAVVTVDGKEPICLDGVPAGPNTTRFHGVVLRVGEPSPDPKVRVYRTRTVHADGMDEELVISSTSATPVEATVALRLGADLTSLAAARAGRTGQPLQMRADGTVLVTWARGGLTVTLSAPGARFDTATGTASWQVRLRNGDQIMLRWLVRVSDQATAFVAPRTPADWSSPAVASPDPRLGRLLGRALDDLDAMRLADAAVPEDVFVAAGVPWFLTLFGRDSLWTARMLLPLGTGLAETTLRTLAARQGTHVDIGSCEEPGKIMHEVRREEARPWPKAPRQAGPAIYYGTVDATMLWISLLADAWRWGMPDETVLGFLPYLQNALGWIADYGDQTGSGFISYVDRTGQGLANQGWKDSGDSVRFRDGTIASPPIALCEVQAYAHRAALDAAALLEAFDEKPARADQWREYAARLSDRFRDRFWVDGPLGAHPALALDRAGRPVDSLTSNIGHLLGTGLLTAAEESQVARLLGDPALAGGYGLRTMSTVDAAFDPMSYHCGSIWPHDTAIALLGLSSMGDEPNARAAVASFASGLLTAAEAFDYRLPELYCGDDRAETPMPLPHPAACRPQAWAAAAPVALLQAVLGLSADAPRGVVTASPVVTGPLSVSGLRVAGKPLAVRVDVEGRAELDSPVAPGVAG